MKGITVLYALCILITIVRPCWSDGKVRVTLIDYGNPSGQKADGRCCDGPEIPTCDVGRCDYDFHFYLEDMKGKVNFTAPNIFGQQNNNSLTGVNQDATFSVDILQDDYRLTVKVYDIDSGNSELVDVLTVNITHRLSRTSYNLTGTRQNQKTWMLVDITPSCDRYYYLDNCSVKCLPNDDCKGHYNCSSTTGERVCLDGWTGPSCMELIPGSENDCSLYTNSGFVTSSWKGKMFCTKNNLTISLNITVAGSTQLDGYVTIDGVTDPVTGSHLSLSETFVLLGTGTGSSTQFKMRTQKYTPTSMSSVAQLNGNNCTAEFTRTEGFFDGCESASTCVRYGREKSHFYCCCGNDSCPTTTMSTSSTPTTASTELVTSTSSSYPSSTSAATNQTSSSLTTDNTKTYTTTTTVQETSESTTQPLTNATTMSTGSTAEMTSKISTSLSTDGKTSERVTTTTTPTLSTEEPTTDSSSTMSTTQATTESTSTMSTTQATTPSTSTMQTTTVTTEPPSVFQPTLKYQLTFEADEKEVQNDENNIRDLLTDAWVEANEFISLNPDNFTIVIITVKGGIGDNREFIVEVTYTVNVTATSLNVSTMVSPTIAHLTTCLTKYYNTVLYTGQNIRYLEFTFSVYISGRPPLVDQYQEINQYIWQWWNSTNGFITDSTYNVTTVTIEELIGPQGEEVSKIYYYIYETETLVHPDNVTKPDITTITSLGRYMVYKSVNVSSLVSYRYTFSVLLEGELSKEDLTVIRNRVHLAWNESKTEQFITSVTVLKTELHVTCLGTFLTKVIYTTVERKGSLIYSLKVSSPSVATLEEKLNISNTRGELFSVYTGDKYFRYSHSLGIYVLDMIDNHDIDKFLQGLETAWQTDLITEKEEWKARELKFRYIFFEKFISEKQEFVVRLVYYLTEHGKTLDGTQFPPLSFSTLKTSLNVTKTNGQTYELVDIKTTAVTEQRFHLGVIFKGVVLKQDLTFLQQTLSVSWNLTVKYSNILVSATEELVTETGLTVTKVYYICRNNKLIVRPVDLAVYMSNFKTSLTQTLQAKSEGKKEHLVLYTGGEETLVSSRYLIHLYFQREAARLDYIAIEKELGRRININIMESVRVHIKRQEECFSAVETVQRVWRLSFVLKTENFTVYPGFYKKIDVKEVAKTFNVTSVSSKAYTLYTGSVTSFLSYSHHFQIHFQQRVATRDWKLVETRIQKAWWIQYGVNITAKISNIEEVINEQGSTCWRLIYSVTDTSTMSVLYPGTTKSLDFKKIKYQFTSSYGTTYTVVDQSLSLWRVSSAFRLLSSRSITYSYESIFNSVTTATWCETVDSLVKGIPCSSIHIKLIRPKYVQLSTGLAFWQLYYFVNYNSFRVASFSWPEFNFQLFQSKISGRISASFYHWLDFDLNFWNFQYFLHFKSRVETKHYGFVKTAIEESWKKENKEYMNATVTVVIDTQQQVFTETGVSEWRLGYHLVVNGKNVRPQETKHINKTYVQTSLKQKSEELSVKVETSINTTFVSRENFASLSVTSNIHKEDKQKFRFSLENYYKQKYATSSEVSVVLGPVEEVVTTGGKTEWRLSYALKVNGSVTYPVPEKIPDKDFQLHFNFTSKFDQKYQRTVTSTTEILTKSSLLEVNMKNKVSETSYTLVEEKLKEAFVKTNTGLVTCRPCLSVKILGQQELITDTGETVWRLHYGVYINGTKVDASFTSPPTTTDLQQSLVFTGPNNVENSFYLAVNKTLFTSQSVHELHFNRPVSETNKLEVTKAVRASWASVMNIKESELKVDFRTSKEYIIDGKSSWGWRYSLSWNSTTLTRAELSSRIAGLEVKVNNKINGITTSRGGRYLIVNTTGSVALEYSTHFPLYFTSKLTTKDIDIMKSKLVEIWKTKKGFNVSIAISQEEVISKTGKSYWKLVYFVSSKESKTFLDSRVEEHSTITSLLSTSIVNVTDVNGRTFTLVTNMGQTFRASQAFNIHLTTRIGKTEQQTLTTFIEKSVREQLTLSTESKVKVEFYKHQELTSGTFESVWKYLFSIEVDGKVISPISYLNGTWPEIIIPTTTGHRVSVLSGTTSTVKYRDFRSSFSFYMKKNVSYSSWSQIEKSLTKSWEKTDTKYKTCGCLSFALGAIHEVVDRKGETFFKILYFMEENTTLIDAMTTRKVSTLTLKSELKEIRSVTGHINQVVDVRGETTRVDTLFGFFLSKKVRIDHWQSVEQTILEAHNATLTSGTSLSVSLVRQVPFLTVSGQKLWKLEYQVTQANFTQDALITTSINASYVQSEIDKVFTAETRYIVKEVQQQSLIDYRHRVELYFSQPIPQEKFYQIQEALNTSYSMSINNLHFLGNEELIDVTGSSVWMLSVLIYEEAGNSNVFSYVPGWGLSSNLIINTTRLKVEVDAFKIQGAHGLVEMLEIKEELKTYQSSLSIVVKNVIKTVDITDISLAMTTVWKMTLSKSVKPTVNVSVHISRQEELVNIDGNAASKLIYHLSVDGKALTKEDLPPQNITRLQEKIKMILTDRTYEVVMATSVNYFRYESLFVLHLTKPINMVDLQSFETSMKSVWETETKWTDVRCKVLQQEEILYNTDFSQKAWKISYSILRNSVMVDSRIKAAVHQSKIQVSLDKKHSVVNITSSAVYRYTDLFYFHLDTRVAKENYKSFETLLTAHWEQIYVGAVVSICKQEEELNARGESVWRLSYLVKEQKQLVSAPTVIPPSYDVIKSLINVTNPRGVRYSVLDVRNSIRVENVFHLYVSKKVFHSDIHYFQNEVKSAVEILISTKETSNLTVVWKGQTEFKHLSNQQMSTWRQLFVVHINEKLIMNLNYDSIDYKKIVINDTAVEGSNYVVISNISSLVTEYARADQQFSLTVIDRIISKDMVSVASALQMRWNETYKSPIDIKVQSVEEYIGDGGLVITRLLLFALKSTTVIDPQTMLSPSTTDVLESLKSMNLNYVQYTGQSPIRYDSCFTLLVKGSLMSSQLTTVKTVLKQAWESHKSMPDKGEVTIHKTEKYYGEFGVTLTQIRYTVRIDGLLSLIDDDVPPSYQAIERYKPDAGATWSLYTRDVTYRYDTTYNVKVAWHTNTDFSAHQADELKTALLTSWESRYTKQCSDCTIHVVKSRLYLTSNLTHVARVSYMITSNKQTLKPWENEAPTSLNLTDTTLSHSPDQSLLHRVRDLYLSGYQNHMDLNKLKHSISSAWKKDNQTNVTSEIRTTHLYTDKSWNKLTRVRYFVSVNSMDPDDSVSPTAGDFTRALAESDRSPCNCTGLKLRKLYLKGKSVNYTAAAIAIKDAWATKNNESTTLFDSLEVHVKQLVKSRKRREAVPAGSIVDGDGKPMSALDYTVSVDGEDPDPTFIESPAPDDLDRSLQDAGESGCRCHPGKVGKIQLSGSTKDDEKKDIEEAVKDAIVKSNPDVDPKKIDVNILDVNNHKDNGKPVSDVTYAVRRRDGGDVESLQQPSEGTLAEALAIKGKTLASKEVVTQKPASENRDWVLPVAIVCSVLAAAIIFALIAYGVRTLRKVKKASLQKAERDIYQNIHNEEHFTNPAIFNNPMYGTPKEQHRMPVDGL